MTIPSTRFALTWWQLSSSEAHLMTAHSFTLPHTHTHIHANSVTQCQRESLHNNNKRSNASLCIQKKKKKRERAASTRTRIYFYWHFLHQKKSEKKWKRKCNVKEKPQKKKKPLTSSSSSRKKIFNQGERFTWRDRDGHLMPIQRQTHPAPPHSPRCYPALKGAAEKLEPGHKENAIFQGWS